MTSVDCQLLDSEDLHTGSSKVTVTALRKSRKLGIMHVSKLYGPAGIRRAHGKDIRAAQFNGFFPTPVISLGALGERVNPALRGEQSRPIGIPLGDARCSLSPRERVRVRGNGAATIPRLGPFPELSDWAGAPVEQ